MLMIFIAAALAGGAVLSGDAADRVHSGLSGRPHPQRPPCGMSAVCIQYVVADNLRIMLDVI